MQLGEQQNFGIKTAGLEDKATACQMLVCYARSELEIDGSPLKNREMNYFSIDVSSVCFIMDVHRF